MKCLKMFWIGKSTAGTLSACAGRAGAMLALARSPGRQDACPTLPRFAARIIAFIAVAIVVMLSPPVVRGAVLIEDSFDYLAGSSLGTNAPWAGSASPSLTVDSGNLSLPTLRKITPAGNMLRIDAGANASAYRNVSATPISSGAVYCSFLINCSTLPASSQLMAGLVEAGATSPNGISDPVDLYVQPIGSGFNLAIQTGSSGVVAAGGLLSTNTTHLIVLKYTFGFRQAAGLYIDPSPGDLEPATPNAVVTSGGGDDDDDEFDDDDGGGGVRPANVGAILFQSSGNAGPSVLNFDTLRVGTAWADVTPLVFPLSLDGPRDEAVCSGSSAAFSVVPMGTPPYFYQWRTNGVVVSDATNSVYQLDAPGVTDTLNAYDVIVHDGFGAITSQVAHLTLSTAPPTLLSSPTDQIATPSSTNAVFTVVATGDLPLSYQWRSNGIPIVGETNFNFIVSNLTSVPPTTAFDVVVANPCGSVTSSPPVSVLYPHVFYAASDAGAGFFGGENLLFTNVSGLSLQSWLSDSLTLPVTNWSLVGVMQEQPLNDGTGNSVYSINVTPSVSPAYYIFGSSVSSPYLTPIPILVVTTDLSGMYGLVETNLAISPGGVFALPGGAKLVGKNLTGGIDLTSTGITGKTYFLQACSSLQPPVQWITIETNVADADGVVHFSQTNITSARRFFRVATP